MDPGEVLCPAVLVKTRVHTSYIIIIVYRDMLILDCSFLNYGIELPECVVVTWPTSPTWRA